MGYFSESLGRAFDLILAMEATFVEIVATSLAISLGAVCLASLAGIPAGIATALATFPGKALLRHLLNALMAVPTVIVGLVLYALLSRRGLLGEYGLLFTPAAMLIGQTVLILPLVWNLVLTTVESADPRIATTCRLLGASPSLQILILLHELRAPLVAAAVMGFGRAIGEVGVAMMLGGNIAGHTRTMTTAIALETSKGEFALALALGVVLLLVAILVNFLLSRLRAGPLR